VAKEDTNKLSWWNDKECGWERIDSSLGRSRRIIRLGFVGDLLVGGKSIVRMYLYLSSIPLLPPGLFFGNSK
jgi:hypothetical protein